MSPKSKLGRNPFEGTKAKIKPAATETAKSAAAPEGRRKKAPRERVYRKSRRRHPPGFSELLKEITHYWVPRVRACVYVRAVRAFSRFA